MIILKFYRLAIKEDFDKELEIHFDAYSKGNIPNEVKLLIEEGKMPQAAGIMSDLTGRSVHKCRGYCGQYLALYLAKCDFEKGLPVYTDY